MNKLEAKLDLILDVLLSEPGPGRAYRARRSQIDAMEDPVDGTLVSECQYHPAISEWPTENLESHICPVCGEQASINEAMAKRLIDTRAREGGFR